MSSDAPPRPDGRDALLAADAEAQESFSERAVGSPVLPCEDDRRFALTVEVIPPPEFELTVEVIPPSEG